MSINKIPDNFNKFDKQTSLELLFLIQEAYNQYAQIIKNPNDFWEEDLTPIVIQGKKYERLANLGFAQYFFLKRVRVPFGFIVKREDTQDIYIVFRGTVNPAEWISNFKFTQQPYQGYSNPKLCNYLLQDSNSINQKIEGSIHRGFYTTYIRPDMGGLIERLYDFIPHNNQVAIREKITETLKNLTNFSTNSRLFITGHSLGGALATITTFHIHFDNNIPFRHPIMYSFASPRVGDEKFAQNFENENLECYRIANSEDIIPTMPLPLALPLPLSSLFIFAATFLNKIGIADLVAKILLQFKKLTYQHIVIPIYFTLQKSHIAHNPTFLNKIGVTDLAAKILLQFKKLTYQHIGIPIYFTLQKGNIADNHILPAYLQAISDFSGKC